MQLIHTVLVLGLRVPCFSLRWFNPTSLLSTRLCTGKGSRQTHSSEEGKTFYLTGNSHFIVNGTKMEQFELVEKQHLDKDKKKKSVLKVDSVAFLLLLQTNVFVSVTRPRTEQSTTCTTYSDTTTTPVSDCVCIQYVLSCVTFPPCSPLHSSLLLFSTHTLQLVSFTCILSITLHGSWAIFGMI